MTLTPVTIKRNMRQSTLTSADICLKRLEYMFFTERPNRGSVNRAIGSGYHAGLAVYYLERRERGYFVPTPEDVERYIAAATDAFDAEVDTSDEFDWRYQVKAWRLKEIIFDRADAIDVMARAMRRYFGIEANPEVSDVPLLYVWPERYQVVAVEMTFEFPWLPTWDRTGTIDLVLWDTEDERYLLVDHKTAKKKWQKKKGLPNNPQAAWYIKAWRDWSGFKDVRFVYDIMGLEGEFERRPAPRTDHQVDLTMNRAVEIAELIDKGGPFPPNPDHFLCADGWCDYWSECPYGSGLNFVDAA